MNKPQEINEPTSEMPRYKCHKEVRALKIAGAKPIVREDGAIMGYNLSFKESGHAKVFVASDWVRRNDSPLIGGYYVVYDDGYTSFSPAAPFEAGYTRI